MLSFYLLKKKRVYASLSSKCKGSCTNVVGFQTTPCQPDQPAPPKLTGLKKKNELTLRWSNSNDNGQKITNFILEYQEINANLENFDVVVPRAEKTDEPEKKTRDEAHTDYAFTSVYKGPLKQFTVKKLNPSTCYAFRLAAENSCGISEFSKPTLIYTSRSVPSVPEAPLFIDATVSTIKLGWGPKRANESDYELQLIDSMTSIHGFLTVYNGPLLEYECTNLNKSTLYQFRLRAKNEEGNSAWSETKSFSTKADVPQMPLKLQTRIQNAPILIRVSWEAPKQNGGDKIISYCLELAEFNLELANSFSIIYEGENLEHTIKASQLNPGAKYSLRVSCANTIGRGCYSDVVHFVCPCTVPGKCDAPKVFGKPKSNSVQLKWNAPHECGGLPIVNYEVNNNGNLVYVGNGNETGCTLNDLLPDKNYSVQLRCLNKIGAGEWSDTLEFTSGAGCPDAPASPSVLAKSANSLSISWTEPTNNGSPITEYRVEWSSKENESYVQLYSGLNLKYELKGGILPSTKYYFRVQAFNANGSSLYSQCGECVTPAAVPSVINSLKIDEIRSDLIGLSWKQPNTNGDPISFYNIDISESHSPSTIFSPITVYNEKINCEYKLSKLQPDTVYKIRIQAANSIGVGQFSNAIKVKTMASLPAAPHLECVSSSYNGIKLKWTHLNSSNANLESSGIVTSASTKSFLVDNKIVYTLEMIQISDEHNIDNSEFYSVYNGPLNLFKVTKLQESTLYGFRVSASNETGQGEWSEICRVNTTKSPPIINKGMCHFHI
jgi:fibronectin type III domain-containing protein 3